MTKTNVKNRVTGHFYHRCVIKSSRALFMLLVFVGFGHCCICSNHILCLTYFAVVNLSWNI